MAPDLRRRLAASSILVCMVVGAGACGSSDDSAPEGNPEAEARRVEGKSVLEGEPRACEPPATIPTDEVADLLPRGLTLPDGAVVVGKVDESTHVTVTAQLEASTGATPTTLRKRYQAELEAAAYEITGNDEEGHESEIDFTFGDGRKGTVQSVKSACPPGTVRVIVSYLRVPA